MCGGAILADLIPAPRSGQTKNKRRRSDDEDFEAAFEDFDGGDDSEEVDEYDGMDAVDDDDSEDGVVVLPPPPPFGDKPLCPVIPHECHGGGRGSRMPAAWGRRWREAVPRGAEAAVGEVGGGDPRPRARRARLARHLPHRRVCRACLRRRRPPPPRRQGQAQLPLRAAALSCSPPQEAPRLRRHALAVAVRHERGHGGVRVHQFPGAGVRCLRRRAPLRRRQVDADDEPYIATSPTGHGGVRERRRPGGVRPVRRPRRAHLLLRRRRVRVPGEPVHARRRQRRRRPSGKRSLAGGAMELHRRRLVLLLMLSTTSPLAIACHGMAPPDADPVNWSLVLDAFSVSCTVISPSNSEVVFTVHS